MSTETHRSFVVFIRCGEGGNTIEAVGPDGVAAPPQPFPTVDEILTAEVQTILLRLGDKRAEATTEEIRTVGSALYSALFTPAIATAYGKAQGESKHGVRLCLQIEPPDLIALPWEAMCDGTQWLSTVSAAPLVRRLAHNEETVYPQPQKVSGALRVLFLGASPEGQTAVQIEDAAADLQEKLAEKIESGKVDLTIVLNAGLADLREKLAESDNHRRKPYHIIYFMGHGRADAICMDDGWGDPVEGDPLRKRDKGDAQWVTAEQLALELQEEALRLVFLAACETGAREDGESGSGGVMQSFAEELTQRLKLPALVAMQYFVSDAKAANLSAQFFAQLAAFEPVDEALAKARSTLIDGYGVGRDVISPILYLQAEESAIFAKARNWPVLALAAVLALVLAIGGPWLYQTEMDKRSIAFQERARELVTLGEKMFDEQPILGLRFAAEGLAVVPQKDITLQQEIGDQVLELARQGRMRSFSNVSASPNRQYFVEIREQLSARMVRMSDGTVTDLMGIARSLNWSPDGNVLFLEYDDGTHRIFRVRDGISVPLPINVERVIWSPNNESFIVEYRDGIAELWYVEDDSPSVKLANNLDAASWSPDGRYLYVRDSGRDNTVWRISDNAAFHIKEGVQSIDWSPNGIFILARYSNQSATLWRTTDFEPVLVENIDKIFWSLDSSYFIVNFTKLPTKLLAAADLSSIDLRDSVQNVYWSPDSHSVVVDYFNSESNGSDQLWRVRQNTSVDLGDVYNVAWSQDSANIFIDRHGASKALRMESEQGLLAPNQIFVVAKNSYVNLNSVTSFRQWSPDGRYLVISYFTGLSEIWDLQTGSIVDLSGEIQELEWSPDGSHVLIAYYQQPYELWQLKDVITRIAKEVTWVFWYGDGHKALINYYDGTTELWDIDSNAVVKLSDYKTIAYASGEGRQIVIRYDDGTYALWHIEGNTIHDLNLGAGVNKSIFSPDLSSLLISYQGNRTYLVNLRWAQDFLLNSHEITITGLLQHLCDTQFSSLLMNEAEEKLFTYLGSEQPIACSDSAR